MYELNLCKNIFEKKNSYLIFQRLEFSRIDEKFFIIGDKPKYDKKFKLVIDQLTLNMKAVDVDKDFYERQLQILLRTNAIYPMLTSSVHFSSIVDQQDLLRPLPSHKKQSQLLVAAAILTGSKP